MLVLGLVSCAKSVNHTLHTLTQELAADRSNTTKPGVSAVIITIDTDKKTIKCSGDSSECAEILADFDGCQSTGETEQTCDW